MSNQKLVGAMQELYLRNPNMQLESLTAKSVQSCLVNVNPVNTATPLYGQQCQGPISPRKRLPR